MVRLWPSGLGSTSSTSKWASPPPASLPSRPASSLTLSTMAGAIMAPESAIPTFFTVEYYEEQDFRDAGIWALKQRGIVSLVAGTPAVELDERLSRRHDEPIIVKKYASAFFGTDLIARLNARRVDTLLVTGCTTSGCVRATAVDTLQLGIRPVVVREAVGDRAEPAHRQSLFDLQQKYADVVSLEEALAYLQTVKHVAVGS